MPLLHHHHYRNIIFLTSCFIAAELWNPFSWHLRSSPSFLSPVFGISGTHHTTPHRSTLTPQPYPWPPHAVRQGRLGDRLRRLSFLRPSNRRHVWELLALCHQCWWFGRSRYGSPPPCMNKKRALGIRKGIIIGVMGFVFRLHWNRWPYIVMVWSEVIGVIRSFFSCLW